MFVAIFVVSLIVAVMLHEFGHFATAKLFGMKADRFFLGFGPTLWSVRKGETEYGVKAIPAGGFVKITGMNKFEEVADADRPRAFHAKPAWQRAIVLVAGSVTHFVIAGLLLFVALAFFALPQLDGGQPVPGNVVVQIVDSSPAAEAGLRPGDVILAVDGVRTDDFDGVREAVEQRGGETVALRIERGEAERRLQVSLAAATPDGARKGFLGVAPGIAYEQRSIGEALGGVFVGEYAVPTVTWRSLVGLGRAFSPESLAAWLAQAEPDAPRTPEGPVSLVGAGQAVSALGRMGEVAAVLVLLAQLNIVLGALNMLPLPPLDGGHLAVLGIERAVNQVRQWRGRSVDWQLNPAVVTPVALAVLLFFVAVSVTALYIDIVNPVSELLQ